MAKKKEIIEKINKIIEKHGTFSVWDVDADHSPCLPIKGRLTHLMEEFRQGDGTVRVYDPSSYSSDEIDEYDEGYEVLKKSQLEWVLELAEQWVESQSEEEE